MSDWQPGDHQLTLELQPLTPAEKQVRSLTIRVKSVTIRGPLDERYWVRPRDYTRFFPKDVPRARPTARAYARELLGPFADQGVSTPRRRRRPSIGWLDFAAEQSSRRTGRHSRPASPRR